jgi:hypothetical protein
MNKKSKMAIIFGVPVLVGLYFIYKQFAKPKGKDVIDTPPPKKEEPNPNPTKPESSNFPLKKGSKNSMVGTLQTLLNTSSLVTIKLDPDNNFGSKTEGALVTVYGKKQIDNAADLDALRKKLSTNNSKASNLDWAWQLIEAQESGNFNYLTVMQKIYFLEIKKNFQGVWKQTGKRLELKPNDYSLNDYVLQSALTDGSLRIEVNKGTLAGMYQTSPSDNLSASLDIT